MKSGFMGHEDDAAFWRGPLASQPAVLKRLVRLRRALLLDAPEEVAPARGTLPVVVGLVAGLQELQGLDLGLTGALVAVDVDTSEVAAGTLESPEGFEPEPAGPPSGADGKGALLVLAEARARTGMGWRPGGSFLLGALLRDLASNRAAVRLTAPAFVDPAAEELVLARRTAFARRPAVPEGLDLEDEAARALVPGEPGLALAADRVVVADPGARALVRVGLRTALRPWERVARPPWVDEDATISGVVPLSLVVCGAQRADPRVVPLRVPLRVPLPDELLKTPAVDGPEVTLSFALDLRTLPGLADATGTLFVSAFSGPHAAGPAPVALISPMSLKGS